MKEILLSVKPEHLAKILNGEKTLEIRKTLPKCELPCKVWLYCTQDSQTIVDVIKENEELYYCDGVDDTGKIILVKIPKHSSQIVKAKNGKIYNINNDLCGKVVGYFILDSVRCFKVKPYIYDKNLSPEDIYRKWQNDNLEIYKKSCLNYAQLEKYLQDKNGNILGREFYAWEIEDLTILDKPFSLKDDGYLGNPKTNIRILKAPQSWCYCKYDKDGWLPF